MSKELKTLNPVTIMKRLSKMLEQSIQDDDEDYFYDRLHFMKQNFDNDSDVYKSNKVEDKIEDNEQNIIKEDKKIIQTNEITNEQTENSSDSVEKSNLDEENEIIPESNINIGKGKGNEFNGKITGGEVGIIFDGRGRPFSFSSKEIVSNWSNIIKEYPQ